eukprot:GHVP01021019.1.p1 GENE.GHVP01021019.1~~GHVP01021019.1.p1  ORF type:complete len:111 (+),score=6.15 GHVP01021019.1:290-622(+)
MLGRQHHFIDPRKRRVRPSKVTRNPAKHPNDKLKREQTLRLFPRMSEAMATNEVEFKLLSDQLNSACEDFGILQANGFTVQDEIHQGNSFEPQFRGWIQTTPYLPSSSTL